MLFAAALLAFKVVSFGNGLVSIFSFGKKVVKTETVAEKVTAVNQTAVLGALEVVVEKPRSAVDVELAEEPVVAEEGPAQMDELDAFLANDDEDNHKDEDRVVYARPQSRLGMWDEDSDDEDACPATVWKSASAGLTSHPNVSGFLCSPVPFEDQVYQDGEEDEVEEADVSVTAVHTVSRHFPKFASFASSADTIEEEDVEVKAETISISAPIPIICTIVDIPTIVVTPAGEVESSTVAVEDKVAEIEVHAELSSTSPLTPIVMAVISIDTGKKGDDVTFWREKLLAAKTDEIKQAIEQTRLDRLEEDNHVNTEKADYTLAECSKKLDKIVEVDEPAEEKRIEDEESVWEEDKVILSALSPIITQPDIAPTSEVNTIPFPRFTNDSFDSLLLAEKMDAADQERQAIATNASVSDASLTSTSAATSIDLSFSSSTSDNSLGSHSPSPAQACVASATKPSKKRKFGRIARFFSRRV